MFKHGFYFSAALASCLLADTASAAVNTVTNKTTGVYLILNSNIATSNVSGWNITNTNISNSSVRWSNLTKTFLGDSNLANSSVVVDTEGAVGVDIGNSSKVDVFVKDSNLTTTSNSSDAIRSRGDIEIGGTSIVTSGANATGVNILTNVSVGIAGTNITTNGNGANGISLNGANANVSGVSVATNGNGANGISLNGGVLNLENVSVKASGKASSGLDVTNATVSTKNLAVSGESGILATNSNISLSGNTSIKGSKQAIDVYGTNIKGEGVFEIEGEINLRNGSTFDGLALLGERANLTIDGVDSSWSAHSDSTLGVLRVLNGGKVNLGTSTLTLNGLFGGASETDGTFDIGLDVPVAGGENVGGKVVVKGASNGTFRIDASDKTAGGAKVDGSEKLQVVVQNSADAKATFSASDIELGAYTYTLKSGSQIVGELEKRGMETTTLSNNSYYFVHVNSTFIDPNGSDMAKTSGISSRVTAATRYKFFYHTNLDRFNRLSLDDSGKVSRIDPKNPQNEFWVNLFGGGFSHDGLGSEHFVSYAGVGLGLGHKVQTGSAAFTFGFMGGYQSANDDGSYLKQGESIPARTLFGGLYGRAEFANDFALKAGAVYARTDVKFDELTGSGWRADLVASKRFYTSGGGIGLYFEPSVRGGYSVASSLHKRANNGMQIDIGRHSAFFAGGDLAVGYKADELDGFLQAGYVAGFGKKLDIVINEYNKFYYETNLSHFKADVGVRTNFGFPNHSLSFTMGYQKGKEWDNKKVNFAYEFRF